MARRTTCSGPAADGQSAGHLRRGVRILRDLGIKTIVIAADHGHLFAEEVGEDMKIDAPGGKTADLHRRVWVGEGGNIEPSYLRTPLASLGSGKRSGHRHPLDFRLLQGEGGARALLPRWVVAAGANRPGRRLTLDGPGPRAADRDRLEADARLAKLTTRFFSVQISGAGNGAV